MSLDKLKVLIMNPDANSRRRIRESVVAVAYKAEVRQARTIQETVEVLNLAEKTDILFVSDAIGAEQIRSLLNTLKEQGRLGKQKIIVTVDGAGSGMGSFVVELYLSGVDGFIAEPYSADEVMKLLEMVRDPSRALTADNPSIRVRRAAELLGSESMQPLDQLAEAAFAGTSDKGTAHRELKRIQQSLQQLFDQAPSVLADTLATVFENATTPYATSRRVVQRAATRVQHPGEIVDELMKLRGLTRERILASVRMLPEQFDQLLALQLPVNDMMARELARVLGKTSKEWVALQRRFDAANPATPAPAPAKS
jgi:plasmid maintenance system antidote protein VapI